MKEVIQEAKGIEHVVYQFKSKGDARKPRSILNLKRK